MNKHMFQFHYSPEGDPAGIPPKPPAPPKPSVDLNVDDDDDDVGGKGRKFTQPEVDAIVAKRVARIQGRYEEKVSTLTSEINDLKTKHAEATTKLADFDKIKGEYEALLKEAEARKAAEVDKGHIAKLVENGADEKHAARLLTILKADGKIEADKPPDYKVLIEHVRTTMDGFGLKTASNTPGSPGNGKRSPDVAGKSVADAIRDRFKPRT